MTVLLVAMVISAGPIHSDYPLNVAAYEGRIPCDRECRTRRRWRRTVRPHRGHLEAIAACESGGRWHINTGNGFTGGLQFTASSWHAVGGTGEAYQASKLEQMFRAVLLSRMQGWGAWPNCG